MAEHRRRRRRRGGRRASGAQRSAPTNAAPATDDGPTESGSKVSQPGARVTGDAKRPATTLFGLPRFVVALLWGVALAFLLLLVLPLILGTDDNGDAIAGVRSSPADQGRRHLAAGETFADYNSSPPTSGPHDPAGVAPGVYDEPQRPEALLQVLEQGGIVIYYRPEAVLPAERDALQRTVNALLDGARRLVLTPLAPDSDADGAIVATAWRHLLALDGFTAQDDVSALQQFLNPAPDGFYELFILVDSAREPAQSGSGQE